MFLSLQPATGGGGSVGFFRVANFEKFQHYKDRNPTWIKLHTSVLDDYAYCSLPDETKAHLILIWVLASKTDNRIPMDPAWIGKRIGANSDVDIDILAERGFIEPADEVGASVRAPWASRYISAEVRAEVLASTGGKCARCPATTDIEIDHIVPVSRGGDGSRANLQPLCRKCNRSKRVHTNAEYAEQVATQKIDLRSIEERRDRGETETETALCADAHESDTGAFLGLGPAADTPPPQAVNAGRTPKAGDTDPAGFAKFWAAYPKRAGGNPRAAAVAAFRARLKDGVAAEALIDAATRYAAYAAANGKLNTELVQQGSSFLSAKKEGWRQNWAIGAATGNAVPPAQAQLQQVAALADTQKARMSW